MPCRCPSRRYHGRPSRGSGDDGRQKKSMDCGKGLDYRHEVTISPASASKAAHRLRVGELPYVCRKSQLRHTTQGARAFPVCRRAASPTSASLCLLPGMLSTAGRVAMPRRGAMTVAELSPSAIVVLLCLVVAAPMCKGNMPHVPEAGPSTTIQGRQLLQSTAEPGGQCGAAANARCPSGQCCSQFNYCGATGGHCDSSCQSQWSASDSACGSGAAPPPPPTGGPATSSGNSLYSGTASATHYYDLKTNCNGETYAENNGYPYCTSTDPANYMTLAQYGTNNVIAIDATVLSSNKAGLCGKLVRVYRPDGSEVPAPDGGNFFVWDACQACDGGGRIDFSVSGARNIDSNACVLGVIPGVRFEVLDTQVQPFVP